MHLLDPSGRSRGNEDANVHLPGKPAPAAAKDAAPEGTDLFNPDAKTTGKRKPK